MRQGERRILFWVLLSRDGRHAWSGRTAPGSLPIENMTPLDDGLDKDRVRFYPSKEHATVAAEGLRKRHLIVQVTPARLG
jgi:hypothetical protein